MPFLTVSPLYKIVRGLIGTLVLPGCLAMGGSSALASTGSTTTTLTITQGGTTPNLIAPGTAVTLTATVSNGGLPVRVGQVVFCTFTVLAKCPATHVVGLAQLTSAGTATLRLTPPPGPQSYQALFLGTPGNTASTSPQEVVSVTGITDTATLEFDGEPGGASTLQAIITGSVMSAPTGTVSFLDTSNSNYVIGTATLGAGTKRYQFGTTSSPTLSSSTAMVAGDFNGDGFLDIVGANDNLSTLIPFYGKGDGTFTGGTAIPTCATPGSLAKGDFNEDGNLDLAVSCPSGVVMILLGRGDGTFSAGASVTTGTGSFSLVTADFNGDGHADLAQANQSTNDVTVLLGHGDGTFTATASNPSTSANPRAAAVGDFNGDGKPDLVISTAGGGTLTLLLGNGDGTFTTGTTPVAGSVPVGIGVGDFDNDGKQDLAVGDSSSSTVTILRGNGDGTFTALPGTLVTGSIPSTILVADFDGDNFADIVVGNEIDQTAMAFIGNANGTFAAGITQHAYYGAGTLTYGEIGDFNGDGKADFVVGVSGGTGPMDCILSLSSESAMAILPLPAQVGTGVHLIVASYPGSGIYAPVTSSPIGLEASPVNTTLSLAISPNASQVGQRVTLTASLAPYTAQNHSTDGELITFKNGGTSVGTGTLQSGVATLNLTSLPAGLNQLSATYAGDTNFTSSFSTTYAYPVVNGTTLTLAATPTSTTYGAAISMTATLTPSTVNGQTANNEAVNFYNGKVLVGTAPLSGGIATVSPTTVQAGSGTLTAKYAGDNYFATATSNGLPYTVSKATPSLTWAPPATATYTGRGVGSLLSASSPTAGTISYTVTPNGGSAAPLLATTVLAAGSYTLTATLTPTDTTNYTNATTTSTLTMNPATLTLVPVNQTRAYGAANPTLAGSVTGGLNGDTFTVTGATTATTVSPVGSYSITYTVTGSNIANYTYTPQTATLTITQAKPALTWPTPSSIVYGTALSATQLNATATVAGTITYQQAAGAVFTAGTYSLTANFTPTDTTNYETATTSVPLTVTRASLTAVPNNVTRVYGTANPSLDGTVTGAVNGDILSLTGAVTATTTSHAGLYPITYTLSGTNASSYTFPPVTGTLTVTQATAAITWGTPSPIVYGTTLSANQLNATASVPGTFTYQPAAGTILGVGTSTLGVTFIPTDSTDYKTSTTTVSITVTPATLTIVPTDITRVYGVANPALTASVTGAVAGDTFTVTGATAATTTSPVGSYPITYTVAGPNLANYTYAPQTATLTVTQAQPTLAWTGPSPIIYGTALSAVQLNATATTPGTITYSQPTGTVLSAGTSTLTANFAPTDTTNYKAATTSVSISVAKAPLAIAANNLNRTFGSANPTFSGSIVGAVNGDSFTETFSTTATAASIVGGYPITPAVSGSNLANYTVTATNGVLTISQAGTATTFALSNSNLTLTASVVSLSSGTPTGNVGFYVGQTLAGTGTLVNGVASFTMASFPAGNVTLTAQYGGDANFTQSSSPALFILAVTPTASSLTVSTAGTVTDSLGLVVAPGYVGTVQFTCSGLPKGTTCTFSPATQTFSGTSSSANVTLTVQTGTTVAGLVQHWSGMELAGLFGMPGLFAVVFYRRKKGHPLRGTLLTLLLLCGVGLSVIGCAGGTSSSSTTTSPSPTPAGSSTFQVLATGSGGLSQTTTVTLNVQ